MAASEAEAEVPEVEVKFRRDLGLRDIVMIGLGPTIGTTIFLLVGPGFAIAGPAILLAFALSFVAAVLTAMSYAELSSAFPETGGGYLWVKTAYSEPVGFLGGWLGWFGHCIVCAFYTVSFGIYVVRVFEPALGDWPYKDVLVKALSLAVLAAFLFVNYRGTKTTGKSSIFVTLALLGVVLTFVVVGLVWVAGNPQSLGGLSPFLTEGRYGASVAILMAMGLTFIVFEGYEIIAQTGEEVRNPERNIPRASWITLSVATAIFVLVGFVTIASVGEQACATTEFAVACAAESVFIIPQVGLGLVVVGVVLGSLTALNSLIFSSSRVAFAMGRDGSMPQMFGRLHPRNRTPGVAILASGLVVGLMVLGLDVINTAASAGLMFILLFILVNGAAIRLRRTHADAPRKYRMPLFPLTPVLGIISIAVLVPPLLLVSSVAMALGLVWVVLGFGVHYLWARRERIVEVAAPLVEVFIPVPKERYHILVPVEDVEEAALVDFASVVARVEDAAVTVLNVIEVPPALPLRAIENSYVLETRLRLGRLTRPAAARGVRAKGRAVVSHRVSEAVLDTIREENVNLLVAGWKGAWRGGRILGTTVDKLVQDAPCDVVVFKTAGLKEKLERILVFNAPAWHVSYATGYAILLAIQHRAQITIYTAATTDEELEKEKVYSDRLAQMCRTHGVPYEEKFAKVRSIGDAVVEEARGYDLLAVGASEEWQRLEYAFGSVPDQIARRAPCPVMMVRKVQKTSEPASKPGSA